MKYRTIGHSRWAVSELYLGTMHFGEVCPRSTDEQIASRLTPVYRYRFSNGLGVRHV